MGHQPRGRPCTHTLVIHRGAVHDTQLDDAGDLVLSDPLPAGRSAATPAAARAAGGSPLARRRLPPRPVHRLDQAHPQPGETSHRRADQFRLVPPHDPHFTVLYGLRNDSEAINAEYRRTLPWARAATLGWRRKLLDLLSWALLGNTLTWHQRAAAAANAPPT